MKARSRFSFSTLIGMSGGILLFLYAVVTNTDHYMMFLSVSSLAMVLGSTIAASLISYSASEVLLSVKVILSAFLQPPTTQKNLRAVVETFVDWGQVYRKGGIAALEEEALKGKHRDPFVEHGIELMGSGYSNHEIRMMLTDDMDADWQRSTLEGKVLNTMAIYSPGFGMVGTIIGLIIMLDNMNGDMAALGKGLALALITTLYGVLLANMIFKPTANQVTEKQEAFYYRRQIITEGFVLLAEKRDGLFIRDRLNAYLHPKARFQPKDSG